MVIAWLECRQHHRGVKAVPRLDRPPAAHEPPAAIEDTDDTHMAKLDQQHGAIHTYGASRENGAVARLGSPAAAGDPSTTPEYVRLDGLLVVVVVVVIAVVAV